MRNVTFFLLIILSAQVFAQKRFEFDFVGKSLHDAVEELSRKHKFKFSYNPTALKEHTLDGKIRANSEAELISKLFEELPFKIQLSDGVYLVIPRKLDFKPSKLAGQIKDQNTGKPLAFAHVQVNNSGTVSDQDGSFSLPPREDTIMLQVSYLGYKPVELTVPPTQSEIALSLQQNPLVLQEVILNSKEFNDLAGKPSFFSLNPDQFDALPSLGETDVFKALQLLPGIRATDETSSGLAIRGSSPSQNLVLMDGFTLYHLDHFFGIFSTLNPNVINNINIHKGGFGPEYGGRISSVIDVAGKAGSSEKFSGGAGVNMLSLNGYIETPLGPNTSLLLGGRRSFTDIIDSKLYRDFLTSNRKGFLESIDPNVASLNLVPSFHFYDLNGKLQHRISDKSLLDVNLYFSEDFYSGDFEEIDDFTSFNVADQANWANAGISVNLKTQFNPKWAGDFTISASEYSNNGSLEISETFFETVSFNSDTIEAASEVDFFDYEVQSSVGDFTIKSNHVYDIDNQNSLKFGLEASSISTFYDTDQLIFVNFNSDTTFNEILDTQADIFSLYGGYQFKNDDIISNIGFRSSYYEPNEKWYVEPRFDLRFRISNQLHLKGAASYHHQFVNQTSLSIFQNTDQFYWVLVDDESIPIRKGSHLIIGGDYSFNNWTLDLEYYRKNTTGIVENQFLVFTPEVLDFVSNEGLNLAGENNTEGLDLFLKYRTNTFTSWISYSLGRSQNQFWYRNGNTPYPSDLDQRHEINLVNILKLGDWELSSVFIYGSGKPFTPPNPDPDDDSIYDLTRVNAERFPAYSRFDLSAKYSFKIGRSNVEAGATLFNVFDTQNIKSRRYTRQFIFNEDVSASTDEDEVRIVALDTYLLGFTPNFFLNIRF